MPAYEELESEVIEDGLCTYCGACVAACPLFHLKWLEGRPKRPEKKAACEDCEVCYHACHRTMFDKAAIEEEIFGRHRNEDEDIGIYKRAVAAKVSDERIHEKAQDGGVVTAILLYLLDAQLIDGAILTGKEEDWMPIPMVATSKEEIISAAGTKYGASPNLLKLRTAVIDDELDNICIVGLPCHVKAVRHLQHTNFDLAPAIKFVIGLFCHGNFKYERMIEGIAERGVNKCEVEKISVSKGVFHVRTRDTELSITLKEAGGWLSEYCQTCDDYSAELADISVGSKGSEEGWSSVILRTEKGEELFSELETKGYLKTKELDNFESLKKDSMRKRQKSV